MCWVCLRVENEPAGDALRFIGDQLQESNVTAKQRDHLYGLIDRVMAEGEDSEEDPELAEAWERARRGE